MVRNIKQGWNDKIEQRWDTVGGKERERRNNDNFYSIL